MNEYTFRDDGVYYAFLRPSDKGPNAGGMLFFCFVHSRGCLAAQWEPVSNPIEITTDFMHASYLWHHDVRQSNLSNPALTPVKADEAGMLAVDFKLPESLDVRLIPVGTNILSMAVVAPWKTERITQVFFKDYDSVLKAPQQRD